MASPADTIDEGNTHNPDDILNPSFIDLFVEEAPPQWTLEDLHHLSKIRNEATTTPSPFQKLPVELVEHITYNLVNFRDIRALANSCTFFRKILFESSNHLFWYRWAKAPHSMCRWDLGYYRQNRAYQNTIVNQQNGKRRKRCQKCMARAVSGMVFKQKTCMDCWEDMGMPANELFFLKNLDMQSVRREWVSTSFLAPGTADSWSVRREWDLLFFYRPGKLDAQLEETEMQVARESRPSHLLAFARKFVRDLSGEIATTKRNLGYRYSQMAYYNSGPNVRRERWYAPCAEDLVCPAEVIQRMFEQVMSKDIGEEWMDRGEYRKLRGPEQLYGFGGEFQLAFPKVDCELQLEKAWREEFAEDLSNLHDCDMECIRKKKGALFKKLWWPRAEERFVDMLVGAKSVQLTEEEVARLNIPGYSWHWRDPMTKIIEEMLQACKWVVPGVSGEWTEESLAKWEKVHGKENSAA